MESVNVVSEGGFSTISKLGFYIFVLVYIIFSAILYFHWKKYAIDKKVINFTLVAYFGSTLTLIGLAGIALFFI